MGFFEGDLYKNLSVIKGITAEEIKIVSMFVDT